MINAVLHFHNRNQRFCIVVSLRRNEEWRPGLPALHPMSNATTSVSSANIHHTHFALPLRASIWDS